MALVALMALVGLVVLLDLWHQSLRLDRLILYLQSVLYHPVVPADPLAPEHQSHPLDLQHLADLAHPAAPSGLPDHRPPLGQSLRLDPPDPLVLSDPDHPVAPLDLCYPWLQLDPLGLLDLLDLSHLPVLPDLQDRQHRVSPAILQGLSDLGHPVILWPLAHPECLAPPADQLDLADLVALRGRWHLR